MKKSLIIITSIIMICILFIGCQTTDATITTSKELNKNLNILLNTVNRLDTIDNEYLVSSDLYTLRASASCLPTPNQTYKNVLANQNNNIENETQADQINLKEDLTNALKNELVKRLYCDENGNCKICDEKYICDNNNMCNNCKQTIICDSNGNCTTCNQPLFLDNNNNCSNCKTSCISSNPNTNISQNTRNCLNKISNNNQALDIELLSINPSEYDDNSHDNTSSAHIDNITNNTNEENSNTELNNDEDTNNNQSYRVIYYSEDYFNPDLLKYKPRFVNNINYDNANSNFNTYIEKLQKLYTMTADVVEANNTLANYKIVILDNIDDAKNLNECILNGNCTPSNNQILALNNYIEDIKSTISNLRSTNGKLTNEINKISSTNTGISQSIEVTNSNYLRILNQIETRISYHENAIATLEQIKYLLEDAQNNPSTNNVYIEDLNSNYNEQNEDNYSDDNNDTILNTYENNSNNNFDNNATTEDSNYSLNDTENYFESNDDVKTNNQTTTSDSINHNATVTYDDDEHNTAYIYNENNNINNDNIDTTNTNIDSYINTNNNLDTFNTTNTEEDNVDNGISNDIIDNNPDYITHEDNLDFVPDYYENNENNNIVNNPSNAPQMVDANYNNGYNGFANSVISQNNLNNDNIGNSSYRYDENGALYNNTNGFDSYGINNINDRNNNVNTYQYNTLVDSINRGTIDNGINTL